MLQWPTWPKTNQALRNCFFRGHWVAWCINCAFQGVLQCIRRKLNVLKRELCQWVSRLCVSLTGTPVLAGHSSRWQNNDRKDCAVHKKGALPRSDGGTQKGRGGRADWGKCGAIKCTSSIVTLGDLIDEVMIMMIEGRRSGLLGFILKSFTVSKETFASCHKRLRPGFYGVHAQWGMSQPFMLFGRCSHRPWAYLSPFFCPSFGLERQKLG